MSYDPRVRNVITPPSANHPSPGFHRRNLPALVVGRIVHDENVAVTDDAEFVVTTPEVRARVRIDLVWCPDVSVAAPNEPETYWGTSGAKANLFDGCTLWLTKRAEATQHGVGCVNVENLVGDIYAPADIPEPGCLGYHVEAETCAEEIWGRFAVGGVSPAPSGLPLGVWVLRVACDQKDEMTEDEWNRVLGKFSVRVRRVAVASNLVNRT